MKLFLYCRQISVCTVSLSLLAICTRREADVLSADDGAGLLSRRSKGDDLVETDVPEGDAIRRRIRSALTVGQSLTLRVLIYLPMICPKGYCVEAVEKRHG